MLPYKTMIRTSKDGQRQWLVMKMVDPSLDIVAAFIEDEGTCFRDIILKNIELVQSGQVPKSGFAGNAFELSINGNTSHIECMIDGCEKYFPKVDVDTEELRQTIVSWFEEDKTIVSSFDVEGKFTERKGDDSFASRC